ncbi:hypothetical protein HanIR_Chr15g0728701 [Helianthus annuus]|nr:hypothetical protein HanIR_Chr15g0728701 [Helianthus annuus]
MKGKIYRTWMETKKARRWDPDRECYLDPNGNIAVDPDTVDIEVLTKQLADEEEARQREWWGGGESDEKKRETEKESQPKKIDDGIIDTSQELTAENLKKLADKVLAAKELEVVSGSGTESKNKVSSNDTHEPDKNAKSENNCKNCMKVCKVCRTIAYLSGKKVEQLTGRVRSVEDQILNCDKLLKASNDKLKELTVRKSKTIKMT